MTTEPKPKRLSDLKLRALVGVALIAVALAGVWFGGIPFWLLCVVLGIVMMGEWADLHATPPETKRLAQYALSVPLAVMMPVYGVGVGFFELGLLAGAAFFVVITTRRAGLARGICYVGLPIMALLILRRQEEGIVFTIWALALVWACDIGAYAAGRFIGGPKLAPAISPNKTWAGLAGGVLLASLFAAFMQYRYGLPLRLTLATVSADRGTELNAAIEVLGLIALRGKVVTGDALHCNRRTVAAINAGGGDWCLALKGNQESLLSDARGCFTAHEDLRHQAVTEETGHGRKETRKAVVVSANALGEHHDFPGLKRFGRIERTREVDGKATSETRFFALSWMPTPETLLTTVRYHWAIENALHWQLDVSFREDAARNRKDNAPANIAVLRRRALDVVRRDTSKTSLSIKLKRAGWDDMFLRQLLNNISVT